MTDIAKPTRVATTARTTMKLIVILGLVIALFIPLQMIQGLIDERQTRASVVQEELNTELGGPLQLTGPWLKVIGATSGVTYIVPKRLTVKSQVKVAPRYRSIFATQAYLVTTTLEGVFEVPPSASDATPRDWREASLGIRWANANREALALGAQFNGVKVPSFERLTWDAASNGSTAKVDVNALAAGRAIPFAMTVEHRGVGSLQLLALGQDVQVEMQANWPSPRFDGSNLPVTRAIGHDAFTASWRSQNGANLPAMFAPSEFFNALSRSLSAAVMFVEPVSHYQTVTRAVKYGLFVILLTFAAFFLFEVAGGLKIHPMQYLFAGASLVIFYLLLLSLAEHVGFAVAYSVASVAVVLLLALYARVMLQVARRALGFGLGLAMQYGILFVILRAEDYALLTGTVTLFVLLALVMYTTRKVNWYGDEGVVR